MNRNDFVISTGRARQLSIIREVEQFEREVRGIWPATRNESQLNITRRIFLENRSNSLYPETINKIEELIKQGE